MKKFHFVETVSKENSIFVKCIYFHTVWQFGSSAFEAEISSGVTSEQPVPSFYSSFLFDPLRYWFSLSILIWILDANQYSLCRAPQTKNP